MNSLRHRLLSSLSIFGILLFVLAAVCPGKFAEAQATNAQMSGKVLDASGAIIPNAEIDLLDSNGALQGKFQSGSDGSFLIVAPRPGAEVHRLRSLRCNRVLDIRSVFLQRQNCVFRLVL